MSHPGKEQHRKNVFCMCAVEVTQNVAITEGLRPKCEFSFYENSAGLGMDMLNTETGNGNGDTKWDRMEIITRSCRPSAITRLLNAALQ